MPAQTVIKFRRGTAAQWTTANPILSDGEMGIETDTYRSKYGDGVTAWTSLPYSVANSSGVASVEWNDILNKPLTFTPSLHALEHGSTGSDPITIAQSQVTNLTTDLAGKAATVHTHAISDVTSLQTALDGKAATVHTHAISDVTSLQTTLDGKAPTVHAHVISDVTGLQTALDGKAATVHTHLKADITDFAHNHAIADVTGLQTALDGKQATITGAATTITSANLTASRALSSDASGKVAASAVTATELGYLSGVTSAVQTQLAGKVSTVNGAVTTASTSSTVVRNITLSTSAPTTGGIDGDVWLVYTP